jgi:hypothetical protein
MVIGLPALRFDVRQKEFLHVGTAVTSTCWLHKTQKRPSVCWRSCCKLHELYEASAQNRHKRKATPPLRRISVHGT